MAKLVLPSNYLLFVILQCLLVFCLETHAVPYDSSFETRCLEKPLAPHYDGGLIVANDQVNDEGGFMGRQKVLFDLAVDTHYVVTGWLQIDQLGETNIAAVLKTDTEYITVGRATARTGCWSMFKGGLTAKTSGPAELYFTANDTEVDDDLVWADSLSVQPFTKQEWKTHQSDGIQKVRKKNVRVQVVDEGGRPVANASVSLTQTRGDFPFGCAINANILHNDGYREWFSSRFRGRVTVFENELKWYSTEPSPGREDYSVPDALFEFTKSLGMTVRGHNVLWDVIEGLPGWVSNLPKDELLAASIKRMNSVMTRYRGNVIHWDVMNENLHNNFFETKLNDPAASTKFLIRAQGLDQSAVMFMNEYNTIEWPNDYKSSPQSYVERMRLVKEEGFNKTALGMGLESHFGPNPDLVSVRTALDQIAKSVSESDLVWVTELDVAKGGEGLEGVMHELASHKVVQGMLLWAPWQPNGGCYAMCLTDDSFRNLPTGDAVDRFLGELTHAQDPQLRGRRTDANGFVEVSLHHGDYRLKITRLRRRSIRKRINVRRDHTDSHVHRLTIPRMQ